jgi:hypothetical protein
VGNWAGIGLAALREISNSSAIIVMVEEQKDRLFAVRRYLAYLPAIILQPESI